MSNLSFSWPARRLRSNRMAIVVHGAEGLPMLVLTLAVILGVLPGEDGAVRTAGDQNWPAVRRGYSPLYMAFD